jgi:hypothetical protein
LANDFRDRQTEPTIRTSIEFRHGLLLRDVASLTQRVAELEGQVDMLNGINRTIRPQQQRIQTGLISLIVASIVGGIVQGMSMAFR